MLGVSVTVRVTVGVTKVFSPEWPACTAQVVITVIPSVERRQGLICAVEITRGVVAVGVSVGVVVPAAVVLPVSPRRAQAVVAVESPVVGRQGPVGAVKAPGVVAVRTPGVGLGVVAGVSIVWVLYGEFNVCCSTGGEDDDVRC